MTTMTFDSLGYFEKLKAAGFTEEQAKVQANAMREVIEERLATKTDLIQLEERLRNEIRKMESEMQKLELRMTLKLGAMLAASVAIVATLVKLL